MSINTVFNTTGTKTISAIFRPEKDASLTVSANVRVVQPLPQMHLKETAYMLHKLSSIELEPTLLGVRNDHWRGLISLSVLMQKVPQLFCICMITNCQRPAACTNKIYSFVFDKIYLNAIL